jgi:hypothetical protein
MIDTYSKNSFPDFLYYLVFLLLFSIRITRWAVLTACLCQVHFKKKNGRKRTVRIKKVVKKSVRKMAKKFNVHTKSKIKGLK